MRHRSCLLVFLGSLLPVHPLAATAAGRSHHQHRLCRRRALLPQMAQTPEVLTGKMAGSGYDPAKPNSYDPDRIRNFCIIAHIDHGKSTLADRLLQTTKTVADREMQDQLLDNMDIERERGITIKMQAARMNYLAKDGNWYVLNLIDTPGHVDFSYEVSRSIQACDGALLVVDASQGVEAQTIANVYLAMEGDLEIVPVLNKIDLPGADVDAVSAEVEATIGLDCTDAIPASAKMGLGIDDILEAIVTRVPPPADSSGEPFRALIFDSFYCPYRGVVIQFRVVDGALRKGDRIKFMASGKEYDALTVGTLIPGGERETMLLRAGEVRRARGRGPSGPPTLSLRPPSRRARQCRRARQRRRPRAGERPARTPRPPCPARPRWATCTARSRASTTRASATRSASPRRRRR
jgi:small GTP-binding protein